MAASNPPKTPAFGHSLRRHFLFPENYTNLNHGSFGAIPAPVLTHRQKLHILSEQHPDNFMRYHSISLLDESRAAVAKVLNAPSEEVVFVTNATTGVNIVLRNLIYEEGDVIIHFGTIYGACGRTVQYIVDTTPATCISIPLAYPVSDASILSSFNTTVQEIKAAGKKPKLVIFDTVSSMPGMRFPWEKMIVAAKEAGVLSLIDGAHGVGNIKIDLSTNQPDFFVSNCHKWLYTPRPAAVLFVPVRNQPLITTSVPTSHYYIPKSAAQYWSPLSPGTKSNFILQFEFNGTIDATPYLCVPAALKFRQDIGGEDAIINYCNTLAFEGGETVAKILGTEIMAPDPAAVDGGRCPMVNIRLPLLPVPKTEVEPVYNTFTKEVGIRENTFVQVYVHNARWWVRISAQVYLEMKDFVWIAGVLKKECEKINERIKSLAAIAAATGEKADVANGADVHVEEVRSAKRVVSGMGDLKVSEAEGEAVTVKG
ncbi:hypothetical protein TWF788_007315 [Orbilia oligospora]|uniref:Aminotransferase class V domain-containing protein n=2 Tax=Orbilia oligospora TaxID=2813651 RepID=A0A6G1LQ76_ORBOL|nr:hypothetical protein TWF788_007315 [Orbilia oligospora]KAF3211066.1 hypothetical protein TWF679_006557 [Orbilia oligospora]KAF3217378.1 hypothetical protein TWF191_008546 [Orbilia oligospora]KAF3230738.1 hypothetical protein TWF192_004355 [Orbilia oligospora]